MPRAWAPRVIRYLAPIVAWAIASIFLGLIVGLAAVFLPPLGAFGIVAIAAVVLLWVMPDLPLVWPSLIRKTFFVMLIADLCVPNYYAVQFGGLPWISARRLATFALIAPFLIAIAASSDVRRQNCGTRWRLVADCYLRRRLSFYGGAIVVNVVPAIGVHDNPGRGALVLVCALSLP